MNPTIKLQKDLMQQALKKLAEIETINSFIRPLDAPMATVMVENMSEQYAEIMSQLMTSVASVPHDNQNVHPVFQELLKKIV